MKLITVTVTQRDENVLAANLAMDLDPNKIVSIIVSGSGALVTYNRKNSVRNEELTTTQTPAAIATLANAVLLTILIPVTVTTVDDVALNTNQVRHINTGMIEDTLVYGASDCKIVYDEQNSVRSTVLIADDTQAAVKALANA